MVSSRRSALHFRFRFRSGRSSFTGVAYEIIHLCSPPTLRTQSRSKVRRLQRSTSPAGRLSSRRPETAKNDARRKQYYRPSNAVSQAQQDVKSPSVTVIWRRLPAFNKHLIAEVKVVPSLIGTFYNWAVWRRPASCPLWRSISGGPHFIA